MQHITNSFSRYCTKDHSDLNAYGMDAYSVDWTRERCYINPQWTDIVRVLKRIQQTGIRALTVLAYV